MLHGWMSLRILSLEDVAYDVELLERELRKANIEYDLRRVETKEEFLEALTDFRPEIILADYSLPQFSAIEALKLLQEQKNTTPVILVTGSHSEEAAVECMKEGAEDYILKASLTRLPSALQNVLRKKHAERNREAAEEALRQSEAQYRLITENTRDLIALLDGTNRFLYASPSFELVLGYSPKELLHTDYFSLVHPDDVPAARTALEQARRQRRQRTAELRHKHREGHWILFDSAASLPAETDGKPRRVVLVSRDISERKRAEREIEHLATFPRFNPNPVLEFGADGALSYFNDAARLMAQAFGQEHPISILPSNTAALVERCLKTAQRQMAETHVSGRTIAWTFYPIQPTRSVHCYAEDITERLHLEAQLRRSQKMESIGQLAAGIAHDFNNILTVIQGHSSLLLHKGHFDADAQVSLKHIGVAAERAANLTRQLLLFSRKQLAQPRPLDLNAVVENVAEMLRVLLGETAHLELNLAADLPRIDADEGMMEQVLMNLGVNSRDAMPRGGRLTISTMVREVDERYARRVREARAGTFVALRVSDTGTGMSSETLAHIFEPFFTTKDIGKGTGLGLATVYGIVKQHHGWIEVDTREGAGTMFTILLPPSEVLAPPPSLVTRRDDREMARGSETILVVEDEAPLRELVCEVLRQSGYTVLAAENGIQALDVWRQHQHQIDLLLTDMMMPEGISGRELADRILAEEPGLRVMFTSGYPMEALGGDIASSGHCFLQKPYAPSVLTSAVRECLDTETIAPPPGQEVPVPAR
jgi:two-component system, cell cycle sensor histidine kinase and response regulator CckA